MASFPLRARLHRRRDQHRRRHQRLRSRATRSLVQPTDSVNRKTLPPTLAHRVLAAMDKRGHVHHWLQQNHDGLAQKAGFPTDKLNEIHGSWFDRHNPVLAMDQALRPDLFAWMTDCSDRADLVIAMGTSLCGMTSDMCVSRCAARYGGGGTATAAAADGRGRGQGVVIIGLQRTAMDNVASLRFFAKIDDVMSLVAKRLRLKLDTRDYDVPRRPPPKFKAVKRRAHSSH